MLSLSRNRRKNDTKGSYFTKFFYLKDKHQSLQLEDGHIVSEEQYRGNENFC